MAEQFTQANSRLKPLDAMRGIAALSVVFFHFTLGHPALEKYFRFGTTGVDLFFIISGFVIFMSLEKSDGIKTFAVNRLCRLYPAYWMGVLFSFVLISIHFHFTQKYPIDQPWITLAGNLTMFQYYLGLHDLEGPYWTMIVEMLFYLLMAALFLTRRPERVRSIGASLCVLLVTASLYVDHVMWVKELFVKAPLLYHFPLFYAGILFYMRYTGKASSTLFYCTLALAFIAQLALFPHTWRACKHMTRFEYLFVLSGFFAVFLFFIAGKMERIANPITLFLGKISFPLYLTHQYLSINLIIPFIVWKFQWSVMLAALFVALPASLLVATAIHYTAEVHGTRMMKRLLTGKKTHSANKS